MSNPWTRSGCGWWGSSASAAWGEGGFGGRNFRILSGLHRDPARGRVSGVCAGIAGYYGLNLKLIRVLMIVAAFINPFLTIGGYALATLLLQPLPEPKPDGGHIDQIAQLVDQIKNNPDSRRLIVSAWNVADIPQMKLPPCHAFFQFYVADGKLSCQLYQRSADIFLGVPFNIASYALLTHMMAQQTGLDVGDFVWTGGDCHLYSNHLEQVQLQLSREPFPLPKLVIKRKPDSIFDYKYEDFEITGYESHPHIKAPVAV